MADGTVSDARDSSRHKMWKWLLLALCAAGALGQVALAINVFGLGGPPWYGYWGVYNFPTAQPYVERFDPPQPGLASARAGIRAGDWIDLREQSLNARIGLFAQPMAMQPLSLRVHRGTHSFSTTIVPSTIWGGAARIDLPDKIAGLVWSSWFIACAFLISIRRAALLVARLLALALVCLGVPPLVVPSAVVTAFFWLASFVIGQVVAPLLLVVLSSRFGARSVWRRVLESCAYAAIALFAVELATFAYALVTLRIDPITYGFGGLSNPLGVTIVLTTSVNVGVAAVAAIAVATTRPTERPRAAWLLLPLPITLLVFGAWLFFQNFLHTWSALTWLEFFINLFTILCALVVTYALLKRRVLDFEFVLSRTLVVATVSLIVVAAFVFLEWFLGSVLAGVSRFTGFIANAALALVLGVSLRYIHRRVEAFVDSVVFRKRHDDERALRDFSKEAAYVTEPNALLDQAIGLIGQHTDARNGAVLLEKNGVYLAARSFGDSVPHEVSENDAAILALKSWHKPLDPHHYQTALSGALVLPMLARGRLAGILLLGERAGGEAYAPDEIEAFSQFAHGVGSALDALTSSTPDSLTALREAMVSMQGAIINELRAQHRPA